MSKKQPKLPEQKRPAATGSGQAGFPAVGTTLASYKYDAFSSLKAQPTVQAGKHSRIRVRFTWRRLLVALAVVILVVGGWLGGKFIYNAAQIFRGNVFNVLSTTRLKGEDRGRVNVLLAGNSIDDPGHGGAELTDSIMLVSIDTKDNSAMMLSIPRDLWVDIPGDGHAKINEAYVTGTRQGFSESDYPAGGMGLLQKVVEENLGVPIDYYGLINYSAFRDMVNAVGGIDVTINSSDSRGLYDPNIAKADGGPLKLSNGTHHLDGQTALNLARARGESFYSYGFPQSDFDRTAHQRLMLIALKNKITSTGVLANPVKLSNLMDSLGKNVTTNFTLSEIRRLYSIGTKIDGSNILSLSLNNANGKNLLRSYTTYSGGSALIPAAGLDDFSEIQLYLKKVMSNDKVAKENASVVVLNATDEYGLAGKNAKMLEAKGMTIATVADADKVSTTSSIIDNSKGQKPATKKLLETLYGSNVSTSSSYSSRYKADFIIIVGTDKTTAKTTAKS